MPKKKKKNNKLDASHVNNGNNESIIEKIQNEAEIIRNISLENDFNPLWEKICHIKKSVTDL